MDCFGNPRVSVRPLRRESARAMGGDVEVTPESDTAREARVDINMWGKGNERKWLCLVSNGSWRDCNQRLIPFHQTNSTLSGAIWKRDVLHTSMQMRAWIVLDCFFGFNHLGSMFLNGWHTCKEVVSLAQVIQMEEQWEHLVILLWLNTTMNGAVPRAQKHLSSRSMGEED